MKERYLSGQFVTSAQIAVMVFQGLMFLVYPLLGHIADVCLNRYRTIKWSFAPVIGGKTVLWISIIGGIVLMVTKGLNPALRPYSLLAIIPAIGILVSIIGVGLYESNIIQFGLDQLLEAPTRKLIAFIHWYYWAQSIGSLLSFYIFIGLDTSFTYITPDYSNIQNDLYLFAIAILCHAVVVAYLGLGGK